MRSNNLILAALMTLALAATACGPQSTPAPVPTEAPTLPSPATEAPTDAPTLQSTATEAPTAAALVNVGISDQLGSFLVDDKGMTLYLFTKDSPGTTTCYDKCATAWPPLLAAGAATAGDGVDGSKLGSTARTDGSTQVTYNGWPLYYYAKDKLPGETVGQGVGSVWYLIAPAGDAIQ